ncbi:MAG: hypothetical protein A2X36_15225 [Elusimicrobia bacterium GWA2_69_24]|nr:MAG: hypothetical protein A2X36_15225 [Elusimicrobia bacterium GWA2_69_24]HBL16832.1 hypothetical protein [Elusimicrobiota bacterium]
MRIAVDAVGESPLRPVLEGALRAVKEEGHELFLFGPAKALNEELALLGGAETPGLSVLDAPSSVTPQDDPAAACREKPDSGLMRSAEWVALKRAEAMVSLGEPTAVVAACLWHLKRLRGVLRPALLCTITTPKGPCLLADAGACLDSKPWHLLQFALMGTLYAQRVLKVAEPTVRLLAAGPCEGRSDELVREALPLLRYAGVRFMGTIRAGDLPRGGTDIVVANGTCGEVAARLLMGASASMRDMIESELRGGMLSKVGGALSRGAIRRAGLSCGSVSADGAPLLGVAGPVVLSLAPNSADAFLGAIRTVAKLAESDIQESLRERLEDVRSSMEFSKVVE